MIGYRDVLAAAERIAPEIHATPVATSAHFDRESGARLFFKCENLQKIGAFKARGAMNAALTATDRARREGFVAHSSGNHGQAVAWAAARVGAPARIVMPEGSNALKIAGVRSYGGEVISCAPTNAAREAEAARVIEERGGALIHPFAEPAVIAGQGTAALELIEEIEDLDCVVAPIGGGGLISGTSIVAGEAGIETIGAEPEAVGEAAASKRAGELVFPATAPTCADGLRGVLAPITFDFVKDRVADVLTVSEAQIVEAMRAFWVRAKLVIEPSSAVALAAVLAHRERFDGKRVGVILTGGNVDPDALPW